MSQKRAEDIIRMRHSCRSYRDIPLLENDRTGLEEFIKQRITGPFGSFAEFILIAAVPSDSDVLKGLGTYGFIRNPAAFIVGILKDELQNLEDFGYSMERIILHATEMGLGSCWLGGSFKRSSFAEKAGIKGEEVIPAVASIGYTADRKTLTDRLIRSFAGSDNRKSRNELFFCDNKGRLDAYPENVYKKALDMVRLAPSASNKQPWRIVKEDGKNIFHFFLERTPGYNRNVKPSGRADLQRVDMGIAMCHFECAAIELGLKGLWNREITAGIKCPETWEYSITWNGE